MVRERTVLDLFCGAGGASMGYYRAGFRPTGVDVVPQKRYPFRFVQADVMTLTPQFLAGFDLVHASPPCQVHSVTRHMLNTRRDRPDLVAAVRRLLVASGRPYVIENVEKAPLSPWSIRLCGLMFGLKVFRHRRFEVSEWVWGLPHPTHRGRRIGERGMACVVGHGGQDSGYLASGTRRRVPADHRSVAAWKVAMGIDWMTRDELAQAIPPAYTEYLGSQLLPICKRR